MLRFTLSNSLAGTFVLTEDPIGWDGGEISLIRSPKYHGVNYARTLSLQFLCGQGKEYLDLIYETQGIDATVDVLVEDSCDCIPSVGTGDYNNDYNVDYLITGSNSDNCVFEYFMEFIINFKEYFRTELVTDVSMIEKSNAQTFNARVDTKVDLFGIDSIDGATFGNIDTQSDITMHSKALTFVADFEIINESDSKVFIPPFDTLYCEIPLYVESSEGYSYLQEPSIPLLHGTTDTGGIEPIWVNATTSTQNITFDIDVIGSIKVSGGGNLSGGQNFNTLLILKIGTDYDSAVVFQIKAPFTHEYFNTFTNVPLTSSLSVAVPIPVGYFVFVTFVITNIATNIATPFPWYIETVFSKFQVKLKSTSVTSPTPAVGTLIYEAFSRVLQSMLGLPDPCRSNYYGRVNASPHSEINNGSGSFTMVMDGFRIRQYPLIGGSKRTPSFSFNDLFETFDVIDDIGVGFETINGEGKVRIERKNYFYSNEKSLTLLNVPNVKVSVATDLYVNDIEIGFETWESSGINGLDEYCATSQYSNGMKSIDKKLDKISKGIASAYLIENIRRDKFKNTATEDTENDSALFVVALNRTVVDGVPTMLDVAEKDENFINVTNVIDPSSVYNLRFAVCRLLLKNIPTIAVSLTKNIGRLIKFTSGTGNYKTITTETDYAVGSYNGQPLSGEQSIQWDGSSVQQTPLYVPEFIEFQYPLLKSEFQILLANPYKFIEVNTGKEILNGYIADVSYKPNSGLTTFKLIRKWQ